MKRCSIGLYLTILVMYVKRKNAPWSVLFRAGVLSDSAEAGNQSFVGNHGRSCRSGDEQAVYWSEQKTTSMAGLKEFF